MEEPPVHGRSVQNAQCPTVGVRQNGLASEFCCNALKTKGNLGERLFPRNAPEITGILATPTLRRHSPHRVEHAIRRIDPVQILCDLRAQEPARHRMRRIPLNLRRPPILDRDEHATSIRTIVRARSMDDLLHGIMIIRQRRRPVGGCESVWLSRTVGVSNILTSRVVASNGKSRAARGF